VITVQQYWSAVTAQTASLTGDAKTNAVVSAIAVSPFASAQDRQDAAAKVSTALPYFTVDANGNPTLVIPPPPVVFVPIGGDIPPKVPAPETTPLESTAGAPVPPSGTPSLPPSPSPTTTTTPPATVGASTSLAHTPTQPVTVPAGQPCPPGYLAEGQSLVTTSQQQAPQTLQQQVVQAFQAGGLTIPPPCPDFQCNPQMSSPMPVTKNDVLEVDVWFVGTASNTLTVNARVMDCNCNIVISQASINISSSCALGTQTGNVCIQLSDGYLLGVSVTGVPNQGSPGDTWVQGAIVTPACGGNHTAELFSGYLVGQQGLGWPPGNFGTPGDGPGTWCFQTNPLPNPVGNQWIPPQGALVKIQAVTVQYQTSAVAGNRMLYLTWGPLSLAQQHNFPSSVTQPANTLYRYTWAPGLQHQVSPLLTTVTIPLPSDMRVEWDNPLELNVVNYDAGDVVFRYWIYYRLWALPT
jgi:hypothetical protein